MREGELQSFVEDAVAKYTARDYVALRLMLPRILDYIFQIEDSKGLIKLFMHFLSLLDSTPEGIGPVINGRQVFWRILGSERQEFGNHVSDLVKSLLEAGGSFDNNANHLEYFYRDLARIWKDVTGVGEITFSIHDFSVPIDSSNIPVMNQSFKFEKSSVPKFLSFVMALLQMNTFHGSLPWIQEIFLPLMIDSFALLETIESRKMICQVANLICKNKPFPLNVSSHIVKMIRGIEHSPSITDLDNLSLFLKPIIEMSGSPSFLREIYAQITRNLTNMGLLLSISKPSDSTRISKFMFQYAFSQECSQLERKKFCDLLRSSAASLPLYFNELTFKWKSLIRERPKPCLEILLEIIKSFHAIEIGIIGEIFLAELGNLPSSDIKLHGDLLVPLLEAFIERAPGHDLSVLKRLCKEIGSDASLTLLIKVGCTLMAKNLILLKTDFSNYLKSLNLLASKKALDDDEIHTILSFILSFKIENYSESQMACISSCLKALPASKRRKYENEVVQVLENYALDYSLPEISQIIHHLCPENNLVLFSSSIGNLFGKALGHINSSNLDQISSCMDHFLYPANMSMNVKDMAENREKVLEIFKGTLESKLIDREKQFFTIHLIKLILERESIIKGDFHLLLLFMLVDDSIISNEFLKYEAFEIVKQISERKNLTVSGLFLSLGRDFKIFIANYLVSRPEGLISVSELTKIRIDELIISGFPFSIPKLLDSKNANSLKFAAEHLGMGISKLILTYGHHAITYGLIYKSDDLQNYLDNCVNLISSYDEKGEFQYMSRGDFIRGSINSSCFELLMEVGKPSIKSTVLESLKILASWEQSCESDDASIKSFLRSNISFLVYRLSEVINGRKNDNELKRLALTSLKEIIEIVEEGIFLVMPRVISILSSSLQNTALMDLVPDLWSIFLRNFSAGTLSANLTLICALFTDIILDSKIQDSLRRNFIKIFQEFLEHWKFSIFEELKKLPFLCLIPSLNLLYPDLKSGDIKVNILRVIVLLSHNSITVVKLTLKYLTTVLQKWEKLEFLLQPKVIDTCIKELLIALLNTGKKFGSGHGDLDHLLVLCIGLLGAIDPDCFDGMQMTSHQQTSRLEFIHERKDLKKTCCALLRYILVPNFRSTKDPRTQDRYAYAIQELLKICEFHPDLPMVSNSSQVKLPSVKSEALELWLSFDQEMKTTLYPLLKTKYKISSPSLGFEFPIIDKASSYQEWITKITAKLSLKLKGHKSSPLFEALCGLVYSDQKAAAHMLPCLALHLIVLNADCRNLINAEIKLVLERGENLCELNNLANKFTFSLIHELGRYKRYLEEEVAKLAHAGKKKDSNQNSSRSIQSLLDVVIPLKSFLQNIDDELIAKAAFYQKEYTLAIMYYESFMRKSSSDPKIQEETYCLYQKMYSNIINEPDGMHGIVSHFGLKSLASEMILNESSGNWTLAQSCYEVSLEMNPSSKTFHTGLLQCMNNCGQLQRSLNHVDGLLAKYPDWKEDLIDLQAEASWRLGDWESVGKVIEENSETLENGLSFNKLLGRILLHFRDQNYEIFETDMKRFCSFLAQQFLVSGSESYLLNYEKVLQSHMLVDLQLAFDTYRKLNESPDAVNLETEIFILNTQWSKRKEVVAFDFKMRDLLLNLHRVCLNLIGRSFQHDTFNVYLEENLIQTCKNARKNGYNLSAYNALIQSKDSSMTIDVERAKWLWRYGDPYEAIVSLSRSVDKWEGTEVEPQSAKTRGILSNTKLLLTRWMDDSNTNYSHEIVQSYRKCFDSKNPSWDKGHFYLARFYNKIFDKDMKGRGNLQREGEYKRKIIAGYSKSLLHGTKYVFQALPKLLTLWLDFGDDYSRNAENIRDNDAKKSIAKNLQQMNATLTSLLVDVPAYIFLSAMSQLTSRICIGQPEVYSCLEEILIKILIQYPERASWYMMSMWKSTHRERSTRATKIFDKVARKGTVKPSLGFKPEEIEHASRILFEAKNLTENLLALCNHPVNEKQTTLNLQKELPALNRICPLRVIIPIQKSINITISSTKDLASGYKPFSDNPPTFRGFENLVELMPSMQKPKKITVLASDGERYIFLCKPKDDLRKDSRLMEFNSVINRLFKIDHDARKRQLYIRTYAVVPLNEECGMIEWVNNTVGYRNILNKLYRIHKINTTNTIIQQFMNKKDAKDKKDFFVNVLLKQYKSIFYEYFLRTFPDPSAWFASRLAYTRTSAVISMVGYVVGLGDRHSENILFDNCNGDTVHVDFNCLFEKGLCFSIPEKVPFRLTHNMVDAFGVTGYDGVFRRCAEVAMKLLREHQETLMNVLETFIHDPLVEWSVKPSSKRGVSHAIGASEAKNEEAVRHMMTIEKKLTGRIQATNLPLSVAGQVQNLIKEATSIENLSQMYVGWAAFL